MARDENTKYIKLDKYKVRITLITELLGGQPQKDVASAYLGSKFVENDGELPEDEKETLEEVLEKGTTGFHKLDGQPILYDYQVKGFLKEAGKTFNGKLDNVKALRSKIDSYVFVEPRRIHLNIPEGYVMEYLERPIRAETAKGPRVGLIRSEKLPEGTWFEIQIEVYESQITMDVLNDLLSYGYRKGLGQWRNGGLGRFEFTLEKLAE